MLTHRLHGLMTSQAKCAFLHGAQADETLALPPTRLILGGLLPPLLCTDPSVGEVVRLDPEASSERAGKYIPI